MTGSRIFLKKLSLLLLISAMFTGSCQNKDVTKNTADNKAEAAVKDAASEDEAQKRPVPPLDHSKIDRSPKAK